MKVSDWFGCNTFNDGTMRSMVSHTTYERFHQALSSGKHLEFEVANEIAHNMKQWATDRGATHFAHWFLPWTGCTAEKHDAFITWGDRPGQVIERFTGAALVQGEPESSSITASVEMRPTFEGRGFAAWDPASPAFLLEGPLGKTLCIPSAFVDSSGQALDHKTPLLRSISYLRQHASASLEFFGIDDARIAPQCGVEQEYYLLDASLCKHRPDITQCSRTLQGDTLTGGRFVQPEHFFGSIKDRVLTFMQTFEVECYKLGIPIKTRHNEVAPNQFEAAPIFEDANLAADHSHLMQEVMERTAERMGLVCNLHEKPFQGIDGSSKHCNWSLAAHTVKEAINLLDPGDEPAHSPLFLFFLMACVRAVDRHAALLRACVASAGNDLRLGFNEAPPTIVSVFLGEQITKTLNRIENDGPERGSATPLSASGIGSLADSLRLIDMSFAHLPAIPKYKTERNHTSPFAFTGNKFELRTVGSSQPVHLPLTVLNAIVGEALGEMNSEVAARTDDGCDVTDAVMEVIYNSILATKKVRYEGDSYSESWVEEAALRGLPIIRTTAEALGVWESPQVRELFEKSRVFTKRELSSRVKERRTTYNRTMLLESSVLVQMATQYIFQAVTRDLGEQSAAIANIEKAVGIDVGLENIKEAAGLLVKAQGLCREIKSVLKECEEMDLTSEKMTLTVSNRLQPLAHSLRVCLDHLEHITDARAWPFPTYTHLLTQHTAFD